MKPNFLSYITILIGLILLNSCNKETPSIVFMPDMYYSVAYDPLQEANLAYAPSDYKNTVPLFSNNNNQTALDVVIGTVYRNKEGIVPQDWHLNVTEDNYSEKYELAKQITQSPLDPSNKEKNLESGQYLFKITCSACHGDAGDGNGSIVTSGAYTGVPNYADRDITVGSVYYVIMHGKNTMGSYAGQLNMADRWKVAEYVINEFKK